MLKISSNLDILNMPYINSESGYLRVNPSSIMRKAISFMLLG